MRNVLGNLVVQKCFDPRSDSQRWGPAVDDDCEVDLYHEDEYEVDKKKIKMRIDRSIEDKYKWKWLLDTVLPQLSWL